MKHFYSHIVEVESLVIELDNLDLSREEKYNLAVLMDANMHNSILDMVLSHLSPEDKQVFLGYLEAQKHDHVRKHLEKKIENLDEKIKKTADEIKESLLKDIKESKKLK